MYIADSLYCTVETNTTTNSHKTKIFLNEEN